MRLYNYCTLFILMILGCVTSSKVPRSYDTTPVLLHLSDAKQIDSIGFNLVKSLPELLYPRILTGDLPLWENSSKKRVVGPTQFLQQEKMAVRPFVRSSDLFIHEYWRLFKRNYEFSIQGFSFTAENKAGKTIEYGYIDSKDVISLLKSESIPCNANGSANLSYWDALTSKTYDFNLVQFGQANFRNNPALSTSLQYQALSQPNIYREFYVIPDVKRIAYKVLPPTINSNLENKSVYNSLESTVNNNKQAILNSDASGHFAKIRFEKWKLDNISITEKWSRYKNIPFQEIESIEFFIDQHGVSLNKKQLEELQLSINLQGIEEYLSEKRFDFLLEKINDQEIFPQQSDRLYNALLTKDWNKITQ